MRLAAPTTAEEAARNCAMSRTWTGDPSTKRTDEQIAQIEKDCAGPWVEDENGNWKQQPPVVITTSTSTPTTATAGFGDNKMLIYLVAAGAILWYMNKEGYLKKILK